MYSVRTEPLVRVHVKGGRAVSYQRVGDAMFNILVRKDIQKKKRVRRGCGNEVRSHGRHHTVILTA